MNPVTHFLVSWSVFERGFGSRRDRALVVAAGVAPDLDGAGIVVDCATRTLGWPETHYYQDFHRLWGHGLAAAILLTIAAVLLAERKWRMALCALLCVHLHLLGDLMGARGTEPEDLWGIYYWAPFSTAQEWVWSGQWPLVGWQNLGITAILLGWVLLQAVRRGYSPLDLFSAKADAAFVRTLRGWFGRLPEAR